MPGAGPCTLPLPLLAAVQHCLQTCCASIWGLETGGVAPEPGRLGQSPKAKGMRQGNARTRDALGERAGSLLPRNREKDACPRLDPERGRRGGDFVAFGFIPHSYEPLAAEGPPPSCRALQDPSFAQRLLGLGS